jgi:biopolymer transport protein ExbB
VWIVGPLQTHTSTVLESGRRHAIIRAGAGTPPSAATGTPRRRGRRIRIVERSNLFKILLEAGWPIVPLFLCSVIAVAVVVERFMALRAARVAPGYLLGEVLAVTRNGLPAPDVIAKLADNSLLGSVLAAGLKQLTLDPRSSEQQLRQTFEGAGRDAAHKLDRYLNTLGTVAAVAPLLGLFGTVVGMIEIFGSQTPQGGNPLVLAHGISIALYNTAFGLVVAVPSMIFYRYFRAKVDALLVDMEMQAIKLVEIIHGERQA